MAERELRQAAERQSKVDEKVGQSKVDGPLSRMTARVPTNMLPLVTEICCARAFTSI